LDEDSPRWRQVPQAHSERLEETDWSSSDCLDEDSPRWRQVPQAHSEAVNVTEFISYQTYEHKSLKQNKPILMPIGTSGPQGKGMKRSTLGT